MTKRKYDKAHKEWARLVKERDNNKCVVCGATTIICAHHLIPWEVEKFRLNIENGITLCSSHHTRYSYGLSPHSDGAALFYFWLFDNRPDIYNWIKENFKNV
jgi:hypothetical protein